MPFNLLYNEESILDEIALLTYINDFTKGLGEIEVTVDPNICRSVLLGMQQDFPHVDGVESASAFKKVANFMTFFIANSPIQSRFSEANIGSKLASIRNHQNVIVSMQLAIDSLHGAVINGRDGQDIKLKNRIQLSNHSYIDIVDALQNATPAMSYKLVTVLLEQLSYKSNPDCQYDLLDL
ncbi:MAG: hypothetical protein N0C81_10060 [Candidatus Thiodiazotropha lotti]|nr:hypothetical protein [Candidatus Thiodiazotropha lotti]MCW4195562.1 hypothetical protein [Candidatus Thiodiazotropha lotti]